MQARVRGFLFPVVSVQQWWYVWLADSISFGRRSSGQNNAVNKAGPRLITPAPGIQQGGALE
jgi:hypothetical protein